MNIFRIALGVAALLVELNSPVAYTPMMSFATIVAILGVFAALRTSAARRYALISLCLVALVAIPTGLTVIAPLVIIASALLVASVVVR